MAVLIHKIAPWSKLWSYTVSCCSSSLGDKMVCKTDMFLINHISSTYIIDVISLSFYLQQCPSNMYRSDSNITRHNSHYCHFQYFLFKNYAALVLIQNTIFCSSLKRLISQVSPFIGSFKSEIMLWGPVHNSFTTYRISLNNMPPWTLCALE